jgi:signal transduction histidine kinase
MASTERPIAHTLPRKLGPGTGPAWAARAKAGDNSTTGVRKVPKILSTANIQKVLLVEGNSAGGELVLPQLGLRGFDVAGEVIQPTEESRQRVKEEFSALVEVLCSAGLGIPSIQISGALGNVIAVGSIEQGGTDYGLKDPLIRLPKSAGRLAQDGKIRKELAEDLLAKKVKELARSNAELEQFAYVTSHDLQEPLRMVANYTQLLAERYSGKLDMQADKYIHYAVEGAVRMQALIQDLLEFSRAGGSGNGLTCTDCNGVVEHALKNLQIAIRDSGAVVTCDNLPVVMCRPLHLEQVFQNLIGNAIKFCGTESPVIQIAAQRKETEWVFSVTDNGISIAPENAEVIFAIFQRLHSRSEYAGNGIGLAICRKIVEQQGGRIWVEPQTSPGATFKFTWPAIEPEHRRA